MVGILEFPGTPGNSMALRRFDTAELAVLLRSLRVERGRPGSSCAILVLFASPPVAGACVRPLLPSPGTFLAGVDAPFGVDAPEVSRLPPTIEH